MRLHADFSKRVLIHSDQMEWVASPMAGVDRRMLDRIGDEVARATTIVRYAPDSAFSAHTHGGGEEFLVLEGIFSDEHGDFPAGSYVRNPPTSSHTPSSRLGCTILVKLNQFDPEDRTHIRLVTEKMTPVPSRTRDGVSVIPLYTDEREDVRLEIVDPSAVLQLENTGGIEMLILAGSLSEGGETLQKDAWLRLPIGENLNAVAGAEGARIWIKEGHLRHVG